MKECPTCRYCEDDVAEACARDGARLRPGIAGGRIVGERYRLERILGSGGMGTVYDALHIGLQRHFALKLIKSENPHFLRRFGIEAEALGKLKHSHIVDVSDFGVDPRGSGMAYLVMEYLEGETLHQYCRTSGTIPLRTALPLLGMIAEAVDYAHRSGILHGDLKPANIFVSPSGDLKHDVKILDFGLARFITRDSSISSPSAPQLNSFNDAGSDVTYDAATAPTELPLPPTYSASIAGTPAYMAPELFQGKPTTKESDIYAFGVLVFQVLTGRLPFEGLGSTLSQEHLSGVPPLASGIAPWLPAELDAPVSALLKKDPRERPRSAREAIRTIEAAAEKAEARAWRAKEIPRRMIIACALGILVTLVSSVVWHSRPLQRLETIAEDLRFEQMKRRSPDPRILIVSIDEASLDADPTPLASKADEVGRQLERLFQLGARGVAVDLLLPAAWSQSETFSQTVLRHAGALVLPALSTPGGTVVGPECVNELTAAALGPERLSQLFAFANVEEDADGVMRHGYLSFTDQAGSRRKSLAVRAAEALEGSSSKLPPQTTKIWLDPSVDPLQFQKLSWKDLDNTLDHQPSLFRDRLVIFGGEFAASGDDHRIPARPLQPALISGLVLQSMMVDTIVRGEFITDLAQSTTLAIAALISALVAFGALCWKKLKYANLVLAGGVVVWAFFCFFLFLSNRIMVQMVPALITIVIAGIMGLIIRLRLRRFPSPGQII